MSAPRLRDARAVHIDADNRRPFGSAFDTRRFRLRDFASGIAVGAVVAALIAAMLAVPC